MTLLHPGAVKATSLKDFLMHELKDLYDLEHQIVEALPKLIDEATNTDLKHALKNHFAETQMHITRLEDCFNMIGEKSQRVSCDGMKGVIKEGEHILRGDMPPKVRDEGIIGAAQRVEHYEMAAYGCARDHAKAFGFTELAKFLDKTLQEEGKADETLTKIAHAMQKTVAKAAQD